MKYSNIILEELKKHDSATSSEIADKTGYPKMKVAYALNYLKSKGQAFDVGVKAVSKHTDVKLYSARQPEIKQTHLMQQTWYSPLLQ